MTKALVESIEDIVIEENAFDEDAICDDFLKRNFFVSKKTKNNVFVDIKIEMISDYSYSITLIPTKKMKSSHLMRALELGKVVCFATPELWEDVDLYHANKNFARSYISCSDGKFICNDLMIGEERGGIETVEDANALANGCFSKEIVLRWKNSFTYTHPA